MPTKIDLQKQTQVIDYRYDEGFRGRVESDIVPTLTTKSSGVSGMPLVVKNSGGGLLKMKIRKLTPKECMRLMGFEDSDYEAMRSINMGDSAIWHCCGDSIVVSVLIAIFSTMLDKNPKEEVNDYVKGIKND